MNKYILFFGLLFFLNKGISAQKMPYNMNLFKQLWTSDTCGQKGYREILARFISLESQVNVTEIFKKQEDVLFWLGQPDKIYKCENTKNFCYIVTAEKQCNLDEEDSVMIALDIYFDNKSNKVISISQSLR